MLRVKSSRRVTGLKPSDFDHEINILDQDNEGTSLPSTSNATLGRASTASPLLSPVEERSEYISQNTDCDSNDGNESRAKNQGNDDGHSQSLPTRTRSSGASSGMRRYSTEDDNESERPQGSSNSQRRPSIEIQAPSPAVVHSSRQGVARKRSRGKRETEIDVLYENERGGFLCGAALFSGKALGGLDPAPWTNSFHKTSPTSIHTATVPDPSWEWAWPEWRINHQDGVDEGGWEYSFAFSGKFSWHSAKWYNSFVRRRAWIRRRVKKRPEDISSDPHMLNTDYFTIRPASERLRRSPNSLASSRVPSKSSMTQASSNGADEDQPDIEDIESLLQSLRFSRIDREKREAVENYLQHATDLEVLQEVMHEIMGLFVFQASRRQLLGYLMQQYDGTKKKLIDSDTQELRDRKTALDAAVTHAEEEVRKLAYWSDVKQMADSGMTRASIESGQGWYDAWEGLDHSGPSEPNNGKLP